MRRFTINDLAINLGEVEVQQGERGCPFHSCGWTIVLDPPCGPRSVVACGGCTLRVTDCTPITSCGRTACHPAVTNTQILKSYDAEDLDLLREELRRELKAVEGGLADLAPPPEPRSLEELEELEQRLGDALAELRRRKTKLGGSD